MRAAGKRKAGRGGRPGEKAVKRRRMVGGVLKHVGAAAPGQQCTHCATQVRACSGVLPRAPRSWAQQTQPTSCQRPVALGPCRTLCLQCMPSRAAPLACMLS